MPGVHPLVREVRRRERCANPPRETIGNIDDQRAILPGGQLSSETDSLPLPPHDLDAERCVLSALMLSGGSTADFAEIMALVSAGDFYQPDHGIIFSVLADLVRDGKPIDAILVRDQLEKRKLLDEIGGTAYLGAVLNTMPSAAHGTHYAKIVREKSLLRKLIVCANTVLKECYAATKSEERPVEIANRTMRDLSQVVTAGGAKYRTIGELLDAAYDELSADGQKSVKTGIRDFDDAMGGIFLGEMVVVAARPSMGKSTLARQIALQVSMAGTPVGLISLEESASKVARNVYSSVSLTDNQLIRRGALTKDDWKSIADARVKVGDPPYFVTDRARRLDDIRAVVALWVARHGVKMILIDYLQRIQVDARTPYERASLASTGVSDLCKELNVAAVTLAQLNRGVETRDNKRPGMGDLRDSGQIEQDADGIVFLHREDFYHTTDNGYQPTGIAELIVAKWRDGVRGKTIKLRSDLRHQRFEDHTETVTVPEID